MMTATASIEGSSALFKRAIATKCCNSLVARWPSASPLRSGQPATGGTRYSMEGGSLRAVARAGWGESVKSGSVERLGVKFPGPTRPRRPKPIQQACSQPAKLTRARKAAILVLTHRVISWRYGSSVAFGAKRTFSEQRLPNRIYEYAP
jgi:hypothetical protein